MKAFDKFGVHELTRLEQREILGGIGSWEGAGRIVGKAVGMIVVQISRAVMDWWEYAETRIPMPLQPR